MKHILSIVIFTFSFVFGLTQKQNFKTDYTLSECKGKIPIEFSANILEKTKSDVLKEDYDMAKSNKERFYANSNYFLHKFLNGGKVLFGDEMSVYVNEVATNLLEKSGNSKLKEKLRFYVLKSNVVNAVCMPDGSIFVTVGLLSQIENEAQLAFVLAHEISHYTLKHGIKSYEKTLKIKTQYKRSKMDYDGAILNLSEHSKDQELESDRIGFNMFINAGYSSEEAMKMLLVLQYSYLPFNEVKFDKTFFNRSKYVIPENYFIKDASTVDFKDKSNEDDTYSSHPNIKKRIENLNIEILRSKSEEQGVKSFGMSSEFEYIQTKARFESQYLNIIQRKFIKTIYECFLLKRDFPNNKFLNQCIAKSLYALSKQKTNKGFLSKDKEIEGNTVELETLFKINLDKTELNILALKMLLELDSKEYKPYIVDLVLDLTKRLEINYDSFYYNEGVSNEVDTIKNTGDSNTLNSKITPEFKILDSTEYASLTKVGKIKYNRAKQKYYAIRNDTITTNFTDEKSETKSSYYKLAFFEEGKDSSFKQLFLDASNMELKTYFEDLSYSEKNRIRKKRAKESSKFKKIELDSILILETNYSIYNRKNRLDRKNSYKLNQKLTQTLGELTDKSDINYLNLLDSNSSSKAEEVNIKYVLKEWKEEMNASYDEKMLSLTQDRANNIFDNIGYDNIMIVGVYSEFNSMKLNQMIFLARWLPLISLVIAPGVWPLHIVRFNKYNTTKYVQIIDRNGYTIMYRKFESNKNVNTKQDELFINNTINNITK